MRQSTSAHTANVSVGDNAHLRSLHEFPVVALGAKVGVQFAVAPPHKQLRVVGRRITDPRCAQILIRPDCNPVIQDDARKEARDSDAIDA